MADDVEARIRASLEAYAALVEEPERRPAVVPLSRARRARRPAAVRWRGPAMVAAAVLAVSGVVWLGVGDTRSTDQSAAGAPADTRVAEDAGGHEGGGAGGGQDTSAEPSAEAAAGLAEEPTQTGVAYPFDLYTHCGVLGADIDGVWFAADPPLVSGTGSAPAGWDDPYQAGTLTRESADVAVFRDDAGHEVRLEAAPESARPEPCD